MNVEELTLWSDNDEKFREMTKDLTPEHFWNESDPETMRNCCIPRTDIHRYDNDGKAYLTVTAPCIPLHTIEELSLQHPEMTFMASYNYEDVMPGKEYQYELKAGESKFVGVQARYWWPLLKGVNDGQESIPGSMLSLYKETFTRLKRNVEKVFRRIDPVTGDGNEMDVHFYDGEVSVSAEGDDWKMKATKRGPYITEAKLYRRKREYPWEEVR